MSTWRCCGTRSPTAPGEVLPEPVRRRVFRPGDLISFRIQNKSPSMRVDVTLLIVGSDFDIHPSIRGPTRWSRAWNPEKPSRPRRRRERSARSPPFGPECLVAIAAPANNPPVDFTALAQGGLPLARAADPNQSLRSPLGELLETAMFRSGSRSGLSRSVAERYGMRVLTWTTAPKLP